MLPGPPKARCQVSDASTKPLVLWNLLPQDSSSRTGKDWQKGWGVGEESTLVCAPWEIIPSLRYMKIEEPEMPAVMATVRVLPCDWWWKFTSLWVLRPD